MGRTHHERPRRDPRAVARLRSARWRDPARRIGPSEGVLMVTQRTIDLGGHTLVADEAGAGGRPLLLVHGFTGNRNDFEPVLEPLGEQGWHVVAPDQRGHGESDDFDDEDAYSFSLFAADLLEAVDRLGWEDFVVLGHSMGGMVAQHLTLVAPSRVRALILMDTSHAHVPVDDELVQLAVKVARDEGLATLVELQRDIEDPLETEAHRRLCETVPGYAERGDANTLACAPAMYAAMISEITRPHDRLADLSAITCPTLVVVGDQDRPFIKPSERMAAAIPGARLEVVPGAGHSPQWENTDGWWAAVGPFLDRLS